MERGSLRFAMTMLTIRELFSVVFLIFTLYNALSDILLVRGIVCGYRTRFELFTLQESNTRRPEDGESRSLLLSLSPTNPLQDNVLMSPMGVPLLADFGISKLDPSSSSSPAFLSSGSGRGSIRWLAYEIFDCSFDDTNPTELERPLHNEKTDVWAFGMTLLVSSRINILHLLLIIS